MMTDRKRSRGFTLLEMLVTMAVSVILIGLTVTSVLVIRKNTQMRTADTMAKEIFLFAQNRLTVRRISGAAEAEEEHYLGDCFTEMPSGYPEDGEGWKSMAFVMPGERFDSEYLADADFGGTYLIEWNPGSGDVFSVFYLDKDDPEFLFTLYSESLYGDRSPENRRKYSVGYYSGNDFSLSLRRKTEDGIFLPQVTFVNSEDLWLEIRLEDMLMYSAYPEYLNITVRLSDESGNTENITVPTEEIARAFSGSGIGIFLPIDSLDERYSLSSVCPHLHPGDDILAVVTITYDCDGKTVSTPADHAGCMAKTNSLFEEYDRKNGVIRISSVRHLNNLRGEKFRAPSEKITVRQTADIDFSRIEEKRCPSLLKYGRAGAVPEEFVPLKNPTLFGSETECGNVVFVAENGEEKYELRNFIIRQKKDGENYISGTGLFSVLNGCEIIGMTMTDPMVYGGTDTGTLAGKALNTVFRECGVRLTVPEEADMSERTGKYRITASDGAERIGGLIGYAGSGSILNDCHAAVNVGGTGKTSTLRYVGGLVGYLEESEVENSYASGDVSALGCAGGLVGTVFRSEIRYSYSTSDVRTDSGGGGLIGTVGDVESERLPEPCRHRLRYCDENDGTHSVFCIDCGQELGVTEHDLGETIENLQEATCSSPAIGLFVCRYCAAEVTMEYGGKAPHTFSGGWTAYDADSHCRKCDSYEECGGIEIQAHDEDTAFREEDGRRIEYCPTCGYEFDKTEPHIHDFSKVTILSDDTEYHMTECSYPGCHAREKQLHAVDSDRYYFENDVHFRKCEICGMRLEAEEHSRKFVPKAADDPLFGVCHSTVCEVCGAELPDGEHRFGTAERKQIGAKIQTEKKCLDCGAVVISTENADSIADGEYLIGIGEGRYLILQYFETEVYSIFFDETDSANVTIWNIEKVPGSEDSYVISTYDPGWENRLYLSIGRAGINPTVKVGEKYDPVQIRKRSESPTDDEVWTIENDKAEGVLTVGQMKDEDGEISLVLRAKRTSDDPEEALFSFTLLEKTPTASASSEKQSVIEFCEAYGSVLKQDGTVDAKANGGLVSPASSGIFRDCRYLIYPYAGYENYGQRSGITAYRYDELISSEELVTGHPYDRALTGKIFPFLPEKVRHSEEISADHYGDWVIWNDEK